MSPCSADRHWNLGKISQILPDIVTETERSRERKKVEVEVEEEAEAETERFLKSQDPRE